MENAQNFATIRGMTQLLNTPTFAWDAKVSIGLLLESAPIAIAVVSQQGTILYVNNKLEEMFGYRRDELIGEIVERLMPTRFHASHIRHRAHFTETPHMRMMGSGMDLVAQRKDGSEFPIEAGLSYLHMDDDMLVMATITDVSRRKQNEEQLEQRVAERTHELARRQQVADGLRHIMAMLNSNHPLPAILDRIVTQAHDLLGADACAIFLVQEQNSQLVTQVSYGFGDDELNQATLPLNEENVAGFVTLHGQPLAIADLAQPPQDGEPKLLARRQWLLTRGYRALMAVPLVIKNAVNGSLVLYYRQPHTTTPEELDLAITLGNQTALAIENERLHVQIERSAVAAERNRLARDLHDAVTQTLFSATMIAEVLPRIWTRSEDEGRRRLGELRELTRGALAEMRTLLLELRPTKLIEVEMPELLRQLAEAIAGRARVPVHVHLEGDAELPADVKVAFYRIAQEALNNVAKHAQASQVHVTLQRQPDLFALTVADDGVGFHFQTIKPEHLGLGIMRERAEDISASLTVESQPGAGATITVRWSPPPAQRNGSRGMDQRK
jgi:PAS domain S-box-containing protein